MKKIVCLFVSLLVVLTIAAQPKSPVPIIFDSDMGPDYDDVGAIALLHAFADSGQATILATIASTKYDGVASVFNVLNSYFNRPRIPIGVPRGAAVTDRDRQHWSDSLLANYPHTIKSNSEAEDAVVMYRRVLAAQPDNSVTIVTVGFLTNLATLLHSGPDSYSPLQGKDLVRQKVKTLVCMAGRFPEGKEFNVFKDAPASQVVYTQWPTPVLLSGFEIGMKIKSGLPLLQNRSIQHSPVQDVFRISLRQADEDSAGRMSWDQTAVLVAVKGPDPFYTTRKGKIVIAADGSNKWLDGEGNHAYLVERWTPGEVEALVNRLMMHQPVKNGR